MRNTEAEPFTMRATTSSYVVLCGVWYLFSLVLLYMAWTRPSTNSGPVALLTLAFGAGFTIWLSGFRLTIAGDYLEYRDGMRSIERIPMADIGSLKHAWVAPRADKRGPQVPRLLVRDRRGKTLCLVNSKVFGLRDLHELVERVHDAVNADASDRDAGLPRAKRGA